VSGWVALALLIVLDVAALLRGHDSRDGIRGFVQRDEKRSFEHDARPYSIWAVSDD
jgi:hypothetical protein